MTTAAASKTILLNRDVRVASGNIPAEADFITSIAPMVPYFDSGFVKRALTGFSAAKFRTIVTVNFSPGPYHAGIVAVTWSPMSDMPNAGGLGDFQPTYSMESTLGTNYAKVRNSQKFGQIINLGTDRSVVLDIPFVYPTPQMPLTGTAYVCGQGYGTLRITTLTPIRDVGAEARAIRYTVNVHLEDVELYGSSLVTQSDVQIPLLLNEPIGPPADYDDPPVGDIVITTPSITGLVRHTGRISQALGETADLVSATSAEMSSAIRLGGMEINELATAASQLVDETSDVAVSALRETSRVADVMGFSNHISTTAPQHMIVRPLPGYFSTEMSVPMPYAGLAPKSSLPLASGLSYGDADVLNVKTLGSIASYISMVSLTPSDAAGAIAFQANVASGYSIYGTANGAQSKTYNICCDTPAARVASMFHSWRGRSVFKFVCATTPFTRGVLKIWHDTGTSSTAGAGGAYDPLFEPIYWDLSKTSSIEVAIPMASIFPYLRCIGSARDVGYVGSYEATNIAGWTQQFVSRTSGAISTLPAYNRSYFNGVISVAVVAPVTAGDQGSTVDIAVLHKIDDFEVYGYSPVHQTGVSFVPPLSLHSDIVRHVGTEMDTTAVRLDNGVPEIDTHQIAHESVKSLRAVIHTAALSDTSMATSYTSTSKGATLATFLRWVYPPMRGVCPGNRVKGPGVPSLSVYTPIDSIVGSAVSYMPARTLPFHVVASMFVGWRGSFNYRIMPPLVPSNLKAWSISTAPLDRLRTYNFAGGTFSSNVSADELRGYWLGFCRQAMSGELMDGLFRGAKVGADFADSNSTCLSLAVPYQSSDLFLPCNFGFFQATDQFDRDLPIRDAVGSLASRMHNPLLELKCAFVPPTPGNDATVTDVAAKDNLFTYHVSCGTDMNFFWFDGCAPIYGNLRISNYTVEPNIVATA